MDNILVERINRIFNYQINNSSTVKKFIERIDEELILFKNISEKEKFLLMFCEKIKQERDEHEKTCDDPDYCKKSILLKESEYFVSQRLEENSFIHFKEMDFFSKEEKAVLNKKIDDLLFEVKILKMGQELIYNDLYTEFEDLKNLYFIGKKNWKQVFLGKLSEMVLSGVIDETISKKIIHLIKEQIPDIILLKI